MQTSSEQEPKDVFIGYAIRNQLDYIRFLSYHQWYILHWKEDLNMVTFADWVKKIYPKYKKKSLLNLFFPKQYIKPIVLMVDKSYSVSILKYDFAEHLNIKIKEMKGLMKHDK